MMMLTKWFKKLHTLINKLIEIDNTQYEWEIEKKYKRQIFLEQRKKNTEYYSIKMKLDVIVRDKRRDNFRKKKLRNEENVQIKKI